MFSVSLWFCPKSEDRLDRAMGHFMLKALQLTEVDLTSV